MPGSRATSCEWPRVRATYTRDVYAHGYYSLSFERVYETARDDYPHVRTRIESVLPNGPDAEQ